MDFEFHFTEELEVFRREVQAFIAEHAFKKPLPHAARTMLTPEHFRECRKIVRELGARGWYAPKHPAKYGGGELDTEHCLVLLQEFIKASEEGRWIHAFEVSGIHTAGVMAFGTEEQKQRLLTPLLRGEVIGWQCFTEPDAGSDLASLKSTAVEKGNEYIINGTKVFVGEDPIPPDYLYWLAVTDPNAPRHHNIGAFFIPTNLPGVHCQPLDLVSSVTGQKWEVTCEDVHCPADRLIGAKTQGWQVSQATLGVERGGEGAAIPWNSFMLRLVDYCKNTTHNGQPLSKDPLIQDLLVEIYTEYHLERLWGLRAFAMTKGQIPVEPFTGTQTYLQQKRFSPRLGRALLCILGPNSLVTDPELQLMAGEVEYQLRNCDCTHFGGTPEMQMIMMARALGLGRSAAKNVAK
jgi:alkylation response protein AidB-like acyl-CoA dehydrogenase